MLSKLCKCTYDSIYAQLKAWTESYIIYHADKTRALKKGLIKIVSGFTTEVNVFYLQTRQNDQEIFRDQNFDYLKLLSKNRVPNKVVLRALLFTDIPKGSWENKF